MSKYIKQKQENPFTIAGMLQLRKNIDLSNQAYFHRSAINRIKKANSPYIKFISHLRDEKGDLHVIANIVVDKKTTRVRVPLMVQQASDLNADIYKSVNEALQKNITDVITRSAENLSSTQG